jgi:hypothetical protein
MTSELEGAQVPDYAQAIAGARAWTLAYNLWMKMGGMLWSAAALKRWENGKDQVAECDFRHAAPDPHCSCGIYAAYDPECLKRLGYIPSNHQSIAGVVAGCGTVIRGGNYWVASRVRVLAFFEDGYPSPEREVMPGTGVYLPTKKEAAGVYNVPVIRYEDYDGFCDDYGLLRFKGRR